MFVDVLLVFGRVDASQQSEKFLLTMGFLYPSNTFELMCPIYFVLSGLFMAGRKERLTTRFRNVRKTGEQRAHGDTEEISYNQSITSKNDYTR